MNQTSRSQEHIEGLPIVSTGTASKASFIARKKQAMSTPNLPAPYQTRWFILFTVFVINFIVSESSVPDGVTATAEVTNVVILEGACANETSLVILDILDAFAQKFEVIQNSWYLLYCLFCINVTVYCNKNKI